MTQQWLTVLGLVLDFTGFMLVLREWWLAFFNEQRQIEMEEQFERMRALRNLRPRAPGEPNPFERVERMQDDQAIRNARQIHRTAMAVRRNTFILSVVLVVGGFVLQIVGAWPGCCPPWITPQN
jgi:hypothetical protein